MRRFIRRTSLTVTRNTAFEQVIRACKEIPRPGQSGTWLTEDMVEAYQLLHELGYAVSYEVWMVPSSQVGSMGCIWDTISVGSRCSPASPMLRNWHSIPSIPI